MPDIRIYDKDFVLRKKLTKDKIIRLIADYEAGSSILALAEKYDVSETGIRSAFRALKIPLHYNNRARRRYPASLRREIAQMWLNGTSRKEILQKWPMNPRTLSRMLNRGLLEIGHPFAMGMRTREEMEDERDPICREYEKGMSLRELSRKYGTSVQRIIDRLIKHGIQIRSANNEQHGTITETKIQRIVSEFKKGATAKDLANILGVSRSTIAYWLQNELGTATHYNKDDILRYMDENGFKSGGKPFPEEGTVKAGELRHFCRNVSLEIAQKAYEIAMGDQYRTSDRVSCMHIILDRAFGKPRTDDSEEDTKQISQKDQILALINPNLRVQLFEKPDEQRAIESPVKVEMIDEINKKS